MKELNTSQQSFPLSCAKGDNLSKLLNLMQEYNKNFLPVVDEKTCLAGTITYRDISKVLAERNLEPEQLVVADAMNYHAQSIYVHEDDATAFYVMRHHQVNYLPVVDLENRLKGIISFFDIARKIIRLKQKFTANNADRNKKSNFKGDSQFAFN